MEIIDAQYESRRNILPSYRHDRDIHANPRALKAISIWSGELHKSARDENSSSVTEQAVQQRADTEIIFHSNIHSDDKQKEKLDALWKGSKNNEEFKRSSAQTRLQVNAKKLTKFSRLFDQDHFRVITWKNEGRNKLWSKENYVVISPSFVRSRRWRLRITMNIYISLK